MYIPRELRIDLDKHQNNVINKNTIIRVIETYKKVDFLEFYINSINIAIEKNPSLYIDDIKEILDACTKQINRLKGIDKVSDSFKEVQKRTSKFSNISIIDTPKEMNDKTLEGVRKDVTYIQITANGKIHLFEVKNVERVKNFLGNIGLVSQMSETELIKYLTSKENSTKISTRDLRLDSDEELTPEEIKEEINQIYDNRIRMTFEQQQEAVIKERMEMNEYLKKNHSGERVEYGFNSNGERIYIVKDEIIKFTGEERRMQILTEDGKNVLNHSKFNNYKNSSVNIENENSIDEYENNAELLSTCLYAMFNFNSLEQNQIDYANNFLEICISNEENGKTNPGDLQSLFDEYYNYAKTENIYPNEKVKEVFARKDLLTKENGLENDNLNLEKPHVLKLERKNENDLNEKAFVATAIILESTLVIGFILSLIYLFK